MERLTARHKNGNREAYYPYCFRPDTCDGDGTSEKCNRCHFEKAVCERLANYEETGLTPEQIREIDRLYTEKCREVAELRQRDTAILPENIKGNKKDNGCLRFGTCPKCKARVTNVESGNYCQNCGQRLKWEERYAGIRGDSGRDKGYAGR